jgi:dTDP-4-dehydrorhamnose 3,5-epimerase-like enzyme
LFGIIPRMSNPSAQVTIQQLRRATDPRGQVFEPLADGEFAGQRNVHVVLTGPQHVRGNHFHLEGTEITTVVGPARVRYREADTIRSVDIPVDEVWRFTFPPRVTHAFQNLGTGPMVLVSFNTLPHDPAKPDMERDQIL